MDKTSEQSQSLDIDTGESEIEEQFETLRIDNFPMPPTANLLYSNLGKRRVKSQKYKEYIATVRYWMVMNGKQVKKMHEWASENKGRKLYFDSMFFFKYGKMYAADGSPRTLDTSNRIKGLHDVVAEILGIDDKWFFEGRFAKFPTNEQTEFVTFDITPMK